MSDEINNEALEEERLMRAMSRQGKNATTPRATIAKKVEPAPAAAPEKKPQTAGAGSVPEWKRRQLERENSEQVRLAEEKARKEESARLIAQRVAEFGSNVDQEDEKVLEYLASPREAEKPDVTSPTWEHEPQLQKDAPKEDDDRVVIPNYDERGEDERARKEEERLMKMIAGST